MASQEIHINTRKTEKKKSFKLKIKFDDSWFDITKLSPNQIESEYPSALQNNKQ
jgi:hypothetical protein